VTSSADGILRLWGTENDFNFKEVTEPIRFLKGFPPILCLGEMHAHADEVKLLINVSSNAFASGGHDKLIILWRNKDELQSLKNSYSKKSWRTESDSTGNALS